MGLVKETILFGQLGGLIET